MDSRSKAFVRHCNKYINCCVLPYHGVCTLTFLWLWKNLSNNQHMLPELFELQVALLYSSLFTLATSPDTSPTSRSKILGWSQGSQVFFFWIIFIVILGDNEVPFPWNRIKHHCKAINVAMIHACTALICFL